MADNLRAKSIKNGRTDRTLVKFLLLKNCVLGANIELYKFDFQGTVDYYEDLEVRQAL